MYIFLFQWRFLLKVFEEPDMYRRYEFLGNQFEAIHEEFKVSSQGVMIKMSLCFD